MNQNEKTNSMVFEREDVFTAQKYLRNLACGRNPLDGQDLPEGGVLADEMLRRALHLSADLLDAWLDNGGFNRRQPSRTRPFELSADEREKIAISKDGIGITTLAANINQVLPYDMQRVPFTAISNWLINIGALTWEEQEDGTRQRLATELGEEMGVKVSERRSVDGRKYKQNRYSAKAQRFIIDNLDGIMEFRAAEKESAEK
ncbi:MAG: hypothetical protein J6T14_07550 [Clostridia bacterium]|nr:hypothetical protein [Clostridia bacterium]